MLGGGNDMSLFSFPSIIQSIAFAPGVAPTVERRIASALPSRLHVLADPASGNRDSTALLFDGLAMSSLAQVLSVPAAAYVDVALENRTLDLNGMTVSSRQASNDNSGTDDQEFCLSITTATVYAHDVSGPMSEKIGHAVGISGDRLADMRLALQEAISNAALHGNLGLPSLCATDMPAFDAYTARLKTALDDTALTQMPVCIRASWDDSQLSLSVLDRGQGFDTTIERSLVHDGVCGRGIPLMRQLTDQVIFEEQGRRAILQFAR